MDGKTRPEVSVPPGSPPRKLVVEDLQKGTGAPVGPRSEVTILYVGVNWHGQPYSDAWTYRTPPRFFLAKHELMRGLAIGMQGMRAGGRREIVVPPRLQSSSGQPATGSAETLVFVVDLLEVGAPAPARALSRVAFVKRADAICKATTDRLARRVSQLLAKEENKKGFEPESTEEGLVGTLLVPALTGELGELRALGAPAGAAKEVDAILSELEQVLTEAEANPKTITRHGVHPFAPVAKRAHAYGLSACPGH